MEIIFILLPISLCLAITALLAYLWAVRGGQFDDLDTPAIRAIFEDETKKDLSLQNKLNDSKNNPEN